MFQQIFAQQARSLFVWPILALVLFTVAFAVQVLRATLRSRVAIDEDAALPLRDEVSHER
jgi:hypothetical protein